MIAIKGTAVPPTTLVSNTHLSSTGSSSGIEAQSFETGANLDGYTVSEVDIRFAETSGKSTTVKIRKNNADNEPGDLVATLTNPASLTADSLNTFTAHRYHAGCEHHLLDNRERGNLIRQGASSVFGI